MGWESPSRWLIIAVVVIVLFGYKKLPDAARSVGRSLRIFKTEIKGMAEDDKAREAAAKDAKPAAADVVNPAPATPSTDAVVRTFDESDTGRPGGTSGAQ